MWVLCNIHLDQKIRTQKMFCCLFVVAACVGLTSGSLTSCDEVRKVFQLRQIGPVKSLPERPREGSDLQVCQSRNLTCCTKKMEERYQVAARQDVQNLLQTSSSSLKFLISRNVAAFQGQTWERGMELLQCPTQQAPAWALSRGSLGIVLET
ncbi:hypothetical protein J4Q44_G00052510 [Coregonus suidteri]|uniref:Uncharacterized protein n=1 Tax=Coregonus suidteri TaxID=861788 RepID=A0AAN8R779_9TELE